MSWNRASFPTAPVRTNIAGLLESTQGKLRAVIFACAFLIFLVSCSAPETKISNSPPVANAGQDREVPAGDPVTLSGAESSDPDGDQLTYTWRFLEKPAASELETMLPDGSPVRFTPDTLGTYVIELTVSDGTDDSSAKLTVNVIPGLEYTPEVAERYDQHRTGEVVTGTVQLPHSDEPTVITFEVIDDLAVFQGDIILGKYGADSSQAETQGVVTEGMSQLWPGGVIPYVIDDSLDGAQLEIPGPRNIPGRIQAAMDHWTEHTDLQFIARTSQPNYVAFVSGSSCNSYIGMIGGRQEITVSAGCATGSIIHEIGHAVGLWHEQVHPEYEDHIRILDGNIEEGNAHNFTVPEGLQVIGLASYDYDSIMHYGPLAFSKNGQPTIETIPPGIPIGQRAGLSTGDIASVKALYARLTEFRGTVRDAVTGSPLAGATVTLDRNRTGTDAEGTYYFSAISCEPAGFRVSKPGYETHQEFSSHSCMQLNERDFDLTPDAAEQTPEAFALRTPEAYCLPTNEPAIRLSWDASNGVEEYQLHRNGRHYTNLETLGTSFDNIENVDAGQTYTYFVRARNKAGHTDSNQQSVTVPLGLCSGETTVGADLVVSGLTVTPPSAPAGSQVTVRFRIENQGTEAALASQARVRINTNPGDVTTGDIVLAGPLPTPVLPAGASRSYSQTVTIPGSLANGNYHVWAIADIFDVAGQANYDNDRAVTSFSIGETGPEGLSPCRRANEAITIADANLEAAIREQLGIGRAPMICGDMWELAYLEASELGISSLDGLQHAANLITLNIMLNEVSDLLPLAGLGNLKHLYLEGNRISSVQPLAGLTNLTDLRFGHNQVTSIQPLTRLTNLAILNFVDNQITSIQPLTGLTRLTTLDFALNNVSNIQPLAGLTRLEELSFWENQVSDISPLAANSGLGRGDFIWMYDNCIDISTGSLGSRHIATLEGRGVGTMHEPQKVACR